MYLHPMSAILLVPASVGCLVECDTPGRFLRIAAVTAGVFVLSLGWLLPIFLTRDIGVHFANWWKTPGTPIGALATLIRNRLPFPPLIMMVLVAYGASRVSLRRRFLIVWLTAIAIFALLAYFGSLLEFLTPLEPARFEVPFFAFATPVAAVGAHEIWRRTGQRSTTFRRTSRVAAAVVVVALALVSVASVLVETAAHGSIATTLPEQAQEIRGWVNASDRDSRLVLESGYVVDNKGGMAPPYFKSDVGLLWAIESGRELIGASPSEGFSTFSFVDVGNGVAFGRPLADWNPADLLKQLETYNVGAMIAWSTQTKQFLDQVQGVVQLQRSDPYAFFGVSGMHSFLMAGKAASVRSSQDCIEIKGAEPGRLILKYHYFKTLRVDPPIPMGPAPLDNGDPNAFIRVDNDAVRDIRIYNAGFTGWGRAKNACE